MLRSLASLAPLPRGLRAAAPQQINRQLNRSAGHTRAYQAAAGMPEQMAPPKRVFADWTGASAPPPPPPPPPPPLFSRASSGVQAGALCAEEVLRRCRSRDDIARGAVALLCGWANTHRHGCPCAFAVYKGQAALCFKVRPTLKPAPR